MRSNIRQIEKTMSDCEGPIPECIYYQASNWSAYYPEADRRFHSYVLEDLVFEVTNEFLEQIFDIIRHRSPEKISIDTYIDVFGDEIHQVQNEITIVLKEPLTYDPMKRILTVCEEYELEHGLRN